MVLVNNRALGRYEEHPDGHVTTANGQRYDSVESLAKRIEFVRKGQPQVPFGKSEEDRMTGWTRPTPKG